jgi:hypothetical protein
MTSTAKKSSLLLFVLGVVFLLSSDCHAFPSHDSLTLQFQTAYGPDNSEIYFVSLGCA